MLKALEEWPSYMIFVPAVDPSMIHNSENGNHKNIKLDYKAEIMSIYRKKRAVRRSVH